MGLAHARLNLTDRLNAQEFRTLNAAAMKVEDISFSCTYIVP